MGTRENMKYSLPLFLFLAYFTGSEAQVRDGDAKNPVFYLYVVAPATDNSDRVTDWTIQFLKSFAENPRQSKYDVKLILVHKTDNGDKDASFPCTASYNYNVTEIPLHRGISPSLENQVNRTVSKFGGPDCY